MADKKDVPIFERLIKGAAVMGRLSREGKRCDTGWEFGCSCADAKKTDFCKAKMLWGKMFIEVGRDMAKGPFAMIESMSSGELNATGLTLSLSIEEVGLVKVGPKGDLSWADFCRMGGEVLPTVMRVLKEFPGSKVVY